MNRQHRKICILSFAALLFIVMANDSLRAQTIYVDAIKGSNEATGSVMDPLSSLEKAILLAGSFTGKEPITIKLAPGLYILSHESEVRTAKPWNGLSTEDTLPYTIEAAIMPDDLEWKPSKMPVIQSSSTDNSSNQFPHCVGILVAKDNVHFKGLKFVGNANPGVMYYYPITRENEKLNGLEISQCYFIGEKNSTPIQGAVWAHGAGTHVDHCIFYECKNALLLFNSISDFSVTHSIIYGSYEAAVWFGPFTSPFVFSNNIVTHCNYFWLRQENSQPAYSFNNSLIAGNDHYMGYYLSNGGLAPTEKSSHTETGIRKTGKILLSEVKTEGLPRDYLNLTEGSDGTDLSAGIFKKKQSSK